MQVLVVEDERRMADLLRQGLEEEGFAVVFLKKARAAILPFAFCLLPSPFFLI